MKKAFSAGMLLLLCFLLVSCSPAAAPSPEPSPAPLIPARTLRISELMASNKASVPLDGLFPDWVELYNPGKTEEPLDGLILRCGKKTLTLSGSLAPGACVLISCERMSLPKEGADLRLLDWNGAVIDSVIYEAAPSDQSLVRSPDGSLTVCRWPSPGYENSAAGYAAFQETLTGGELLIQEVMVYNDRFPGEDGAYHDWVELKNVSDRTLSLRDYHLTEKSSEWGLRSLPDLTLEPGRTAVLYSDVPDGLPLRLSSREETLLLYRDDGSLCDAVLLHDVPSGASVGRMDGHGGFFYFTEPSPGADNSGGLRRVTLQPASDRPGGVFDGVKDVTVGLSGEGEIRYTLDGSLPTENSKLYTEPLCFTQTSVLRAVCFAPDALPGRSLDLSFVVNEGHSLPVVSVIADPEALFDDWTGIYTNPEEDWEIPASAVLFAEERGFAPIECGLKIHGDTSRTVQDKKSFKLQFRGHYGGTLACDLFDNGITQFDSILLRNAVESDVSTQMRDILMHELAAQCSASLPTQAHRYCVLYLNGEYWGLYALREAHSAAHYARHYGFDPAGVTMSQGVFPPGDATDELKNAVFHAADPEVYARLCELLDMENIITWSVIESFSGNLDIFPPNVRFYRSVEDGQLRYALVDLDLGLFTFGDAYSSMLTGYIYSGIIQQLLENTDFRSLYLQRLSEYLHGPLSDENYLAVAHQLADEIRGETERDYVRWNHAPFYWGNEVRTFIYSFVNLPGGHAYSFALSAKGSFRITPEEWAALFEDLKQ